MHDNTPGYDPEAREHFQEGVNNMRRAVEAFKYHADVKDLDDVDELVNIANLILKANDEINDYRFILDEKPHETCSDPDEARGLLMNFNELSEVIGA